MARAVRPIWSVRNVGPCHRTAARLRSAIWAPPHSIGGDSGAKEGLLAPYQCCFHDVRIHFQARERVATHARFREPDPFHPTPRGQQGIAELVAPVVLVLVNEGQVRYPPSREQQVLRRRAAPTAATRCTETLDQAARTWSRTHLA